MKAIFKIVIDKRYKNDKNEYPIKLYVNYNKKRHYYSIKKFLLNNDWNYLSVDVFKKIMSKSQRGVNKDIRLNLDEIVYKAKSIANSISDFTIDKFNDELFNKNSNWELMYNAFNHHIKLLKQENRTGHADTITATLTSIAFFEEDIVFPQRIYDKKHLDFKKYTKLKLEDIDKNWLVRYSNYLEKNKRSKSTIGKHLRNVRLIINEAMKNHNIRLIYPFNNFIIPSTRNNKRPLTEEQISKIANYNIKENKNMGFYRDLFIFSFVANGMNISDICRLKYSNIINGEIIFEREKIKRKSNIKRVSVPITKPIHDIIKKHGVNLDNYTENRDDYIFPVLNNDESKEVQYKKIKQINKLINKYLRLITTNLFFNNELGTTISFNYARHAYATIMRSKGAGLELISDNLGHSSIKTTALYVSIDNEKKHAFANDIANII